ncbi:type I restriction enzyme subunit R domain-containing protein [Paulownia witches'-broom phytoplasma]|uniref:type I restriction enzyme subunit R domain-containing protein n=1 Tax=Paulownia witches'-broom phytoplasma TaxID=39647 RepID=UPI003CC90B2D
MLNSYHDLTQNKKYNALFAVSNIDDLIEYYNIFKNKENEHDLKIAAICSEHFNSENEKNDDKREAFKSIKSDFYKNFSKKTKNQFVDDKTPFVNEKRYHEQILEKMKTDNKNQKNRFTFGSQHVFNWF